MNVNYNIGTEDINNNNIPKSIIEKKYPPENYDLKEDKAVLEAMNKEAMANKPFVAATDEVTFNPDGTITANRINMTIQGGKVQFGKPVFVKLPIDKSLTETEQKEKLINASVSNAQNVLNCVFLVKDGNGNPIQVSIESDKKNPYSISVSTRSDFNSEFKPQTNNTFNKSVGTSDDAIKAVIKNEIEKYGIENLTQFAIAKSH